MSPNTRTKLHLKTGGLSCQASGQGRFVATEGLVKGGDSLRSATYSCL